MFDNHRLQGLERSLAAATLGSGGKLADVEKKLQSVEKAVEAAASGNGGRVAELEKKLSGKAGITCEM
jgi:hypothetical protein